jgi:hypothetical protein
LSGGTGERLELVSFGESAVADEDAGDAGEGEEVVSFALWRRWRRRQSASQAMRETYLTSFRETQDNSLLSTEIGWPVFHPGQARSCRPESQ